jgi:mono/diheme cytochrome c family protein
MRRATLGFVLLMSVTVATAQGGPQLPAAAALVPESLIGSASFDLYCSSCHGRDGTGNGPVAAALRLRPPDLTTLARSHRGAFPRDEVREYVEGSNRPPAAHGSSDMPVWGPTLRVLEPSDARVRVRLDNLVAFIESIQQPPAPVDDHASQRADGAALFRTYCATCHGANARGDGPMSGALLRMPADLTKYATRNAGVFPAARLTRIIDGRGVTAHGSNEMPVWGNVFRREGQGLDQAAATARIEALVRFLESIQERPGE